MEQSPNSLEHVLQKASNELPLTRQEVEFLLALNRGTTDLLFQTACHYVISISKKVFYMVLFILLLGAVMTAPFVIIGDQTR